MRLLLVRALIFLAGSTTFAGTISIRWNPLVEPEVTGYRVDYGLQATAMTSGSDAGLATETTIAGLADCTTWYLSVRAYNRDGLESSEPSDIVRGWPRPVVTASQPRSISPGETALLTITGTNFDPGVPGDPLHPGAVIEFSHPGLRVLEVLRDACGQVRVRVEAAPDAEPGWSALTVKNFDVSWVDPTLQPKVFGRLERGLEVLARPADSPSATIVDSHPVAGQRGVSIASREVRVQFDRDMRPLAAAADASELRRAFRVLSGGKALSHATGSPAFEQDGRTVVIRLRDPLRAGLRYATFVDLTDPGLRAALVRSGQASLAMRRTWITSPEWKTVEALVAVEAGSARSDTVLPLVIGGSRPASQNAAVPVDAEFRLTFAEPVFGPSVTPSTIRILAGGKPLATAEWPQFEDAGRTVVLRAAGELEPGEIYRIQVRTGRKGVKLQVAGGGVASIGAPRLIQVHFATEISAEAQSRSLGLGE